MTTYIPGFDSGLNRNRTRTNVTGISEDITRLRELIDIENSIPTIHSLFSGLAAGLDQRDALIELINDLLQVVALAGWPNDLVCIRAKIVAQFYLAGKAHPDFRIDRDAAYALADAFTRTIYLPYLIALKHKDADYEKSDVVNTIMAAITYFAGENALSGMRIRDKVVAIIDEYLETT